MLVSLQTGEILALAFSNGKRHDFQLFKDSHVHVKAETVLEADTGYQGLALFLDYLENKNSFTISANFSAFDNTAG